VENWEPEQVRMENPMVREFGAAKLLPELMAIILR
jgi:hypothetical protein